MFDVLIRGGKIVNGTGTLAFKSDVAIDKDKIRILRGDASSAKALRIIDATDCIVAPGIIDPHTHSDLMALAEPLNEPKIRQGVCTEIMGSDGIGYAPLSRENITKMLVLFSGINGYPRLDYDWRTIPEYMERFHHKTSCNTAYLIPNGCLRANVIGWENRPTTVDEIRLMQRMIRQGMEEGACGLSTGLDYPLSGWATTDELVELCKTVRECGGIYSTHVRYSLGDGVFDGFREAVTIGRRSGCPVHLSHYFAIPPLRGKTEMMMKFIDEAIENGIDITFDAYPYEAGSSSMIYLLPWWAFAGGPDQLLKLLKNPNERGKLRSSCDKVPSKIEQVIISAVNSEKNKWCEGLTLMEVADKLKKDFFDTICDLLAEENLGVTYYNFSGDMGDVKVLVTHPAHMFCTDGLRLGEMPNPRTYGTFPKVLGQMVRDEKVLPMEQAIRKMTSFPAQRFGLTGRGLLMDDMKADIFVFNPATVRSTATFEKPKQYPHGITHVFINGQLVLEKENTQESHRASQ